jgi:hypothetical protein
MRTRLLILSALISLSTMAVGSSPAAVNWDVSNHRPPIDKGISSGGGPVDGREGGESFATATPIQAFPYSDTGSTCGHVQDVTLPCANNAAPDVFYSFTPGANENVNVDLCGSSYDTALGVYDSAFNNIGCNDDFCGLQSEIDNVALQAGQTYYFVVSGYGANCGSYTITLGQCCPGCELQCPPGALLENEPPCHDEYVDTWNSGCQGPAFQLICPQAETNSAVMCGKSGTYLFNGQSYRDTDWFQVYGNDEVLSATVRAEFPVQLMFIYGTDCSALQYDWASGRICEDATLSRTVAAGTYVWIWVGPSVFTGIPCESDYILTLTGLGTGEGCAPVPVERQSWGRIKTTFR